MFNCQQYGNTHYLSSDLTLSCDDETYRRWQAAAIAMIVIYVIGIPSIGFTFVFYYRNHLEDPSVLERFRFLYEGYSKHAYFWEFIIILRKVALVTIVVFLGNSPFRSVYAGIWLLLVALLAHLWVSPYVSPSLEVIESATLCVLLATLLFGMLAFAADFSHNEKTFYSVIIITINVIITVVLCGILLYSYYNMILKDTRFNKLLAKVKRFLESKRMNQTAIYDPQAAEMDDLDAYANFKRVGSDVTVADLKGGRDRFKLAMDDSDGQYLSNHRVSAGVSSDSITPANDD